jgi:hypothetical protein
LVHALLVDHRQRDVEADAVNDQEQQGNADFGPQFGDFEDGDKLIHASALGTISGQRYGFLLPNGWPLMAECCEW